MRRPAVLALAILGALVQLAPPLFAPAQVFTLRAGHHQPVGSTR